MGANPTVISQWFDLLKKIQMEVGIVSPAQIWSGDETGVQNVPKEIKVLGIKILGHFNKYPQKKARCRPFSHLSTPWGMLSPQ